MRDGDVKKPALGWLAAGAGALAAGYATVVGLTWWRYGHPTRAAAFEHDALLDQFMPVFDVVERHHIEVEAPAAMTLLAARRQDLASSPAIRAIFKGRELIMGATGVTTEAPKGLLAEVLSLGWVILAEVPDRELVVGAVTKPWEPNVTFRSVPPDAFADFDEPGYVRIVWSLRADPLGPDRSRFLTETRAAATDAYARVRFRWYWAFLSPGIALIRWLSLRPVKIEAERLAG